MLRLYPARGVPSGGGEHVTPIEAPHPFEAAAPPVVFLGGSIEMGAAEDWQTVVVRSLTRWPGTLLNPRRKDWDATRAQSLENPAFVEQVSWELAAQEVADLIVLYFSPGAKSPITLLELGLCAGRGTPALVCCPAGFWRKGNIDLVCQWYHIPETPRLPDLVASVAQWVAQWVARETS